MKKFVLALAFLSSVAFSLQAVEKEKIYLSSKHESIAIRDNQIFVYVNDQWQQTESLFSDANGIYVLGRKWYEPWECSYCGAINPPHRVVCWNCDR